MLHVLCFALYWSLFAITTAADSVNITYINVQASSNASLPPITFTAADGNVAVSTNQSCPSCASPTIIIIRSPSPVSPSPTPSLPRPSPSVPSSPSPSPQQRSPSPTPSPSPPPPTPSPSPPPRPRCPPPLTYLEGRGDDTIFIQAIEAAGLTNNVNSSSAVQTIFVPTDEAWASFFTSQGITQSQLISQTSKLQRLLQNHILPNVQVKLSDLTVGATWPTLNANQNLTVAGDAAGAVVGADLRACNTILQEVNGVLVPPGVLPLSAQAQAEATSSATTPTSSVVSSFSGNPTPSTTTND